MATYHKDALYPNVPLVGTSPLPGGGYERVQVEFSPEDVRHHLRRVKEMLQAGVQIPVAAEHQSRARPMTREQLEAMLAEQLRLVYGHVKDAYLDDRGVLVLVTDVPREDDCAVVDRCKFASPEIDYDVVDGSGRSWPGASITHLAITPRPVQHRQDPFRAVALGLRHPYIWHRKLRLSLGETMADEPLDDFEDEAGDDMPEESDMPAPESEGGGENQKLAEVMDALANMGLILAPDTTPENLLDHLHTAALTAHHHAGGAGETTPEDDEMSDDLQAPAGVDVAQGAPIMMSLQRQNAAMRSQILAGEREKLAGRIRRLKKTGRVPHGVCADLTARLPRTRLSLGADGKLEKSTLVAEIEAYERLPAGRTRLGLPTGVYAEEPPGKGAPLTGEQAQGCSDWILGRDRK